MKCATMVVEVQGLSGTTRDSRVDIFHSAANDTITTFTFPGGAVTVGGQATKSLVAPTIAHLVLYLSHPQTHQKHKRCWIAQGSILLPLSQVRAKGEVKEVEFCEVHEPDSLQHRDFIPSGVVVTLKFTPIKASANVPSEVAAALEGISRILPSLTYDRVTEELYQKARCPGRPYNSATRVDDTDTAAIAVDWVGSTPLPLWKTDLSHLHSQKWPNDLLLFLLKEARGMVPDTAANKEGAFTDLEVALRWFQTATQLFCNSIPYTPDTKYATAPGSDRLVNTEVFLDPLLLGCSDCEELGGLATEIFTCLQTFRGHGDKDISAAQRLLSSVAPQMTMTYQRRPTTSPFSGSGGNIFHGTSFVFYKVGRETRWVGLDGVNPRLSLPGCKETEALWHFLQQGGFMEEFSDLDLRYELWDHKGSAWASKVLLIESMGLGGGLKFYKSPKGAVYKTPYSLPAAAPAAASYDKEGYMVGTCLTDLDKKGNVVAETREPMEDASELWRLKPCVNFPSTESLSTALVMSNVQKGDVYTGRIVWNPPALSEEDEQNQIHDIWTYLMNRREFSDAYGIIVTKLTFGQYKSIVFVVKKRK